MREVAGKDENGNPFCPWDPDPCEFGCVFETFGDEALMWWNIFANSTEKWTDPKTKRDRYGVNWEGLRFMLEAYDQDKLDGLEMVRYISDLKERVIIMDDDVILGRKPLSEED